MLDANLSLFHFHFFVLYSYANPDRPTTIYRKILRFLHKMKEYEPRLGYHLLFYLKAKVVSGMADPLALNHSLSVNLTVYQDFAKMSEQLQEFDDLVLADLEVMEMAKKGS